jgi:hypothetical protein
VVRKFGEELQLQLAFSIMAWTFSWLWFGLSSWYPISGEHYIDWLLVLGFSSGIILSVKVKVLEGGIHAYGWVTILRYCLS